MVQSGPFVTYFINSFVWDLSLTDPSLGTRNKWSTHWNSFNGSKRHGVKGKEIFFSPIIHCPTKPLNHLLMYVSWTLKWIMNYYLWSTMVIIGIWYQIPSLPTLDFLLPAQDSDLYKTWYLHWGLFNIFVITTLFYINIRYVSVMTMYPCHPCRV